MESLTKAINHLGFRSIKNVLLTNISRQIFVSHDPRINSTISALWEHSAVGLLARNVAGISGCRDVEPAYIAGLLHDVGKIVVAAYLLSSNEACPSERPWTGLISITGSESLRNCTAILESPLLSPGIYRS